MMYVDHHWHCEEDGRTGEEAKEWEYVENPKLLHWVQLRLEYLEAKQITKKYIFKFVGDCQPNSTCQIVKAAIGRLLALPFLKCNVEPKETILG